MDSADANYSFNPWMRPEVRLGDDVDPGVWLDPADTIVAIMAQSPIPPPAGYTPRLGYPVGEPGIEEVLNEQSYTLMRDTPTRQDSGMQGTLRPASGDW